MNSLIQKLVLVLALPTMIQLAPPAQAVGGQAGDWEIGPFMGGAWLDHYGDLEARETFLYGLRAGYWFHPVWSAELAAQRIDAETHIDQNLGVENEDLDLDSGRLNVLYNFNPGKMFRPFFTLGLGAERIDAGDLGSSTDFGINGGAGARWLLTDHLALRLDGRYVSTKVRGDLDERQNNVEANIGLTWIFGGGSPRDGDGDGVPDGKDACPDTPAGATVDAKGCPKDSDSDGVFDGIDQCPETTRGSPVDARGCPLDTDGDGVPDGTDSCPATPRGAKVDTKGCPADADGDGVFDGIDACPSTPKGAKVDARGCPLDGDRDNVYDGLDRCPDTPRGDTVDANGCTVAPPPKAPEIFEGTKKTLILEGVSFDTDKADITPQSGAVLDEVAESLKAWPDVKVEVGGHTDSSGTVAHNLELSNRRAESVKAYLVRKGVDPARLTAKGHGQMRPVDENNTEDGKAKNRRVELTKRD